MSHDGFTQYWCKKGHVFQRDHVFLEAEPERCPHCGSEIAFTHPVDQTNGYLNDAITTEVVAKAKMCTCHCGHKHEIAPARYKIPTARDVRNARRRRVAAEIREERDRQRAHEDTIEELR